MSITSSVLETPHQVNRITVAAPTSYDTFKAAYEEAVPVLAAARFEQLVAAKADWSKILEVTEENAPHHFIRYWTGEFSEMFKLSGATLPSVEYLMGNHTIAQRMYVHNPAILLYAPLRTAIHEDADGRAWFLIDQPSTRFSSFDNPDITDVGKELDRHVAALLRHLNAPVPAALTES
jgi:hypothetical protein